VTYFLQIDKKVFKIHLQLALASYTLASWLSKMYLLCILLRACLIVKRYLLIIKVQAKYQTTLKEY